MGGLQSQEIQSVQAKRRRGEGMRKQEMDKL